MEPLHKLQILEQEIFFSVSHKITKPSVSGLWWLYILETVFRVLISLAICVSALIITVKNIHASFSPSLLSGWRAGSFSLVFQLSIRSCWTSWRRLQPRWKGEVVLRNPHTHSQHFTFSPCHDFSHSLNAVIGLICSHLSHKRSFLLFSYAD